LKRITPSDKSEELGAQGRELFSDFQLQADGCVVMKERLQSAAIIQGRIEAVALFLGAENEGD